MAAVVAPYVALGMNKPTMCAQLLYLHFCKLPQHDRRFRLTTTDRY
jgi:hypothetical protein